MTKINARCYEHGNFEIDSIEVRISESEGKYTFSVACPENHDTKDDDGIIEAMIDVSQFNLLKAVGCEIEYPDNPSPGPQRHLRLL